MELAQHMLVTFGSIHRIANASVEEISKVKGITTLTATRLKACISLGRRLLTPEEDRNPIHSPGDSAAIFTPMMAHLEYECLMVMVLDARNKIIEVVDLYHGSLNSSTVRVAEIFKAAIRLNSPSVIIAHNHPSGDPTPSPEDISLTRSIVQSGKLMNIILLDHLVICTSKWVSLKEKGLGF